MPKPYLLQLVPTPDAQPRANPELVRRARDLLETLPYPVIWIGSGYEIRWSNPAATGRYGRTAGRCHQQTHAYPDPCDRHGEICPMAAAIESGQVASTLHAHHTLQATELFNVIALPIDDGSVLEMHVPINALWAVDPLTGLSSRQFFEEHVVREIQLLARLNGSFALVMADLDHFKDINDEHGHPAGDAMLRAVGKAISSVLRATDLGGRWGGEEFCVFAPSSRSTHVEALLKRLQEAVRRCRPPSPWSELSITASFGAYVGPAPCDFQQALALADQAMYRAKHAGRDRFRITIAEG